MLFNCRVGRWKVGNLKKLISNRRRGRSRVQTPGFSLMDIKVVGAWSSQTQYLIDEQQLQLSCSIVEQHYYYFITFHQLKLYLIASNPPINAFTSSCISAQPWHHEELLHQRGPIHHTLDLKQYPLPKLTSSPPNSCGHQLRDAG